LDTERAVEAGRYIPLDARQALSEFLLEGWPRAARFAEVVSGVIERAKSTGEGDDPRVFAFEEMAALLWAEGKFGSVLQLEQLWNELGEKHSFFLSCAYPMQAFDREEHGEAFLKICAEHSTVIPAENYTALIVEEQRLRTFTRAKQKAQTLKAANEELEILVNERTKKLKQENQQILEQAGILEMANQGLRQLSAHLLHVQDEERRRIARDLHDNTAQSLALLSMNLSALEAEATEWYPDLAEGLSENLGIVKRISTELRKFSYLLHPPLLDEVGLESALRWYVDGFGQSSRIKINLELPANLDRLPPNLETAIFRVVQECLTNIHLHSESPTATIRISQSSGKISLEIKDEGKGIAPEKLSKLASPGLWGLGLRSILERIKDFQGDLEITSHGRGTQINVNVPLAAAAS
jgi:signal transduction histidine kinase